MRLKRERIFKGTSSSFFQFHNFKGVSFNLKSSFFQEALLSLAGGSALIGVGVVTVDAYGHPQLGSPAGKVE